MLTVYRPVSTGMMVLTYCICLLDFVCTICLQADLWECSCVQLRLHSNACYRIGQAWGWTLNSLDYISDCLRGCFAYAGVEFFPPADQRKPNHAK